MADTMLVLGGSGFVGPAVALEGLARGLSVTTFHRSAGGWTHPEVQSVRGDRLDPASLAPLTERSWDLVVDTWSGAPRAVRDSARNDNSAPEIGALLLPVTTPANVAPDASGTR